MSTISLPTNKTRQNSGPPRFISFELKKPFVSPVFIGIITITENTGLAVINGVIVPGTGINNGGTCDLQLPTSLFGPIWDAAPPGSKPIVTLNFNPGDFSVNSITVAAPPAALVALDQQPKDAE